MPWTFSLFHCSASNRGPLKKLAPTEGGTLSLALPYGVRTFLDQDKTDRERPEIHALFSIFTESVSR